MFLVSVPFSSEEDRYKTYKTLSDVLWVFQFLFPPKRIVTARVDYPI